MTEHLNHKAVTTFLTQIPVVKAVIARTEKFDGTDVRDGYTTSWTRQDGQSGFTAISYDNGQFSAFFERVIAPGELAVSTFGTVNADAETAGRSIADLI